MPAEANVTQTQRWNGESGRNWIAHRDRHAAIRQRLTPHLLRAADISRGDRVLDIGCGCGETTIAAAQVAIGDDNAVSRSEGDAADGRTDGGAVGLDLSAPMLEVARQLAADACVSNVSFIEGDAQVYPLALASYDRVISSFGVMFFDDPTAAFANIVKALRPGGRLAFLCWQGDLRNELFGIPLRAFMTHTHLPEAADDDFWADQAKVTELLADAGLTDISMEAISEPARLGSDVADVMDYVTGMRMVTGLVAELADDALTERVLATMEQEYADRQEPGGVWVQTAAWLVSARRQ